MFQHPVDKLGKLVNSEADGCCLAHAALPNRRNRITYYEYLRTFSQELGARIVEMYPPLWGQAILFLLQLGRFYGNRFQRRP